MTKKPKTKTGRISITSGGIGYVTIEGQEKDTLIEANNLGTALHGDTVEITRDKVVRVIERARTEFVGIVARDKGRLLAVADDRHIHTPFELSDKEISPAAVGNKVVFELTEWDEGKFPRARVTRVIGHAGEHETEMQAIALGSGFDAQFPYEVEREADAIPHEIPAEEIARRRDMRMTPTFTIDPADAKDFDDAISFLDLGDNKVEVGVHIADVSHYLKEDSALDREALRRATSVYLVDRTIPMLPEVLSNDLCSLNPHTDKLTFSAVFIIGTDGTIHDKWFGKTVINSAHRFTYEEAQAAITSGEGTFAKELRILNAIAKKLRDKKFAKGAIAFESDEVRFRLDEQGVPVDVYKKERTDSHLLVEDFMLLANRAVAEYIGKQKGKLFVFRNHDIPNIDRIAQLTSFVQNFGYKVELEEGGIIPSSEINDLLSRIEGTPEENVIQTATLRSMAKAVYSTKNIGHYSLAFRHYTHFTSPIRRYPDVMVHRLLFTHLTGKNPKKTQTKYEEMCFHSTEREIQAANAERASIKYKQVEYMSKHVGDVFDGVISGVTGWGMYVETINEKCEGMIRLSSLENDYYKLEEATYSLVGEKTGKRYRLGDEVKVKVVRASMTDRTIDFALA